MNTADPTINAARLTDKQERSHREHARQMVSQLNRASSLLADGNVDRGAQLAIAWLLRDAADAIHYAEELRARLVPLPTNASDAGGVDQLVAPMP